MRLLTERASSFALGVNDCAAPDEYLPQQVQVLVNGRPTFLGNGIEAIRGWEAISEQINHTDPEVTICYGAIEYRTAAGVQQIVAAFSDEMYYSLDGGRTFTQIAGATSLREDYWSFVIIREGAANVLCCANGGTNSYEYDGTTWSTIANAPSGTKFLAVMGNRLWFAGGDGITVTASAVSDIETQSLSVVASTNDGDVEITGLFQLGSVLLVFKRDSVGFIEGFGYQTLQVETGARGVSRSVGCVAFRSIAPLGDHGVMWLGEQGFYAYFVGGVVALASEWQRTFTGAISYDAIRQVPGAPTATWWARKQEYVCAVPVHTAYSAALGTPGLHNTWLYCYRPGTEGRAPAAYMRRYMSTFSDSLSVSTDGELTHLSDDQTGLLAKIGSNGELDVTSLPDPGNWVSRTNGELHIDTAGVGEAQTTPSCLFTADYDGEAGRLMAGTYASQIAVMDSDAPDQEFIMVVRSRPFLFGDEFARKKAKRVTVAASQGVPVTGTLRVITDGEYGTAHTLEFDGTTGAGPQELRARVGGRARTLQVDYRTALVDAEANAAQTIAAISMDAQFLDDQP